MWILTALVVHVDINSPGAQLMVDVFTWSIFWLHTVLCGYIWNQSYICVCICDYVAQHILEAVRGRDSKTGAVPVNKKRTKTD
jgi:hypothetical protein